MATAQATPPEPPTSAALRPVPLAARRRTHCAACGRELGLLEARHLVDGAPFHTVCVPSR